MGGQLRASLKPLNTIVCCDVRREFRGPSIEAPMMPRYASLLRTPSQIVGNTISKISIKIERDFRENHPRIPTSFFS